MRHADAVVNNIFRSLVMRPVMHARSSGPLCLFVMAERKVLFLTEPPCGCGLQTLRQIVCYCFGRF
jgi:hypothetical protein